MFRHSPTEKQTAMLTSYSTAGFLFEEPHHEGKGDLIPSPSLLREGSHLRSVAFNIVASPNPPYDCAQNYEKREEKNADILMAGFRRFSLAHGCSPENNNAEAPEFQVARKTCGRRELLAPHRLQSSRKSPAYAFEESIARLSLSCTPFASLQEQGRDQNQHAKRLKRRNKSNRAAALS